MLPLKLYLTMSRQVRILGLGPYLLEIYYWRYIRDNTDLPSRALRSITERMNRLLILSSLNLLICLKWLSMLRC